jgi:hypothetical protein
MKRGLSIIATVVIMAGGSSLFASNSDDIKWIAECMLDNKDGGVSESTVYKYCQFMNSKMSDDESQSITQWEKSHPKERTACEKKANWK